MNLKNGLLAAAFVALAVVAAVGWTRKTTPSTVSANYAQPADNGYARPSELERLASRASFSHRPPSVIWRLQGLAFDLPDVLPKRAP